MHMNVVNSEFVHLIYWYIRVCISFRRSFSFSCATFKWENHQRFFFETLTWWSALDGFMLLRICFMLFFWFRHFNWCRKLETHSSEHEIDCDLEKRWFERKRTKWEKLNIEFGIRSKPYKCLYYAIMHC